MLCNGIVLKKSLNCYKLRPKVIQFAWRHVATDTSDTVDLVHTTLFSEGATKPPLMIFHGFAGFKEQYKGVALDMQKATGRSVILVDARNHGQSPHSPNHTYIHMAHDAARLIAKLGLAQVSLLGHSMGGRTAMALSLLRPDLVSSMISVDISPASETSDDKKIRLSKLLDVLGSLSIKPGLSLSETRDECDKQLMAVVLNANTRKKIIGLLVPNNTGAPIMANIPALKKHSSDIYTFPPELNGYQYFGASLFFAADKSNYIGQDGLEKIQKFFPKARLAYMENASHLLLFEHQEKFVDVASEFLNECEN